MQEQALKPQRRHRIIKGDIAVLRIARHRLTEVLRVHADLMRTPGVQGCFDQTTGLILRQPREVRRGPLAGLDTHGTSLGAGVSLYIERTVDQNFSLGQDTCK